MKKKIFIIISLLLFITACGYTKEEKEQMKLIEKNGKKNALNYIEEKYDIDAKVEKVVVVKQETDPIPDFTPPPTGDAYVTLSYKDKEFHVLIDGLEETTKGKDDYQYDDIKEGIIEEFNNKIPYTIDNVSLSYGDYNHKYLISDYYNGDNIKDIINNNSINIDIYYVNVNSLDISKNLINDYPKSNIQLLNFKDTKSYDSYLKNINSEVHDSSIDSFAYNIYLKDMYIVNSYKKEENYYKYNIKNIDNISYYASLNNKNANISLEKTTIKEPSLFDTYPNYKNFKVISDAYQINIINSDITKLYIYLDKSINTDKNIFIGYECYSNKTNSLTHYSLLTKDIGDYREVNTSLASCNIEDSIKIIFFSYSD